MITMVFVIVLLFMMLCVIPLVIGSYVYRDAGNRGMERVLWAFIAALGPGFIGLIIYLLIRNDLDGGVCPSCEKAIKRNFLFCPFCGADLSDILWKREKGQEKDLADRNAERGLTRIIAMVIAIPLILCILMVASILVFSVHSSSGYSSTFVRQMFKSDLVEEETSEELMEWIESCDESGEGIYVLQSENKIGEEVVTKVLLYRNDGFYDLNVEISQPGFFKKAEVAFICIPYHVEDEVSERNYTLAYYEYVGEKGFQIEVTGADVDGNVQISHTEDFYVDLDMEQNVLAADVYVSGDLSLVGSVGWMLYNGEDIIASEGMSNADGETLAGSNAFFLYRMEEEAEVTAFQIYALDDEGILLYETELFPVEEQLNWDFVLELTDEGRIRVKEQPY